MFTDNPRLDIYQGFNPAFVKQVWNRRREQQEKDRLARIEKLKREAPHIRASVETWKREVALRHIVAPRWVKDIIIECCETHNLEITKAITKSRRDKYCLCRREIMWRIRHHEPQPSFPMIGRWLNLDHTTVMYGVRKHQEMLDARGNS